MIMKRIQKIVLVSLSIFAIASCVKPEISVNADFTTNKDVYELYEDVIITNKSTATNDIIVACKWDWGTGYVWGKQLEKPLSFETVGEKEITLTAVTHNNVSGTVTKKITVQDTNKQAVVDFTWTPETGIAAGDEVQFKDLSSDPDGQIVAWEWKFGSNVVTEQNPTFIFNEFGDIEVVLTVTDNQKKKASAIKTIHVDKSPNSLEIAWSKPFDSDNDAFVKFASPATNADGSMVYAFSSGLHLAAFDAEGNQKWSFDGNVHNPNQLSNDGSKTGSSCTPSVDADGTIYFAVAYNEKDYKATVGINESGVFAVNPDGSQKWYFAYGNARFINVVPMILEDKIFLTTKYNPEAANYPELWAISNLDNGFFLNKSDGSFAQMMQIKQGSYGGQAATAEETIVTHCNDAYGSRVLWKENGSWKYYGKADNRDVFALGYSSTKNTGENGASSYMAIDKNNRVYILYGTNTGIVSEKAVLYCYDLNKYNKSAGIGPEWTLGIDGTNNRYYGLGVVLGEDGTIYVSTRNGITAVDPSGTRKWFTPTGAETSYVWGSPAVDNQGYIYYNESDGELATGKLIKLKSDGTKASEITLGASLRSSPTIAPDGTIYCTGMKEGKVTLFAVKGSATGPAAGWSQLGGNPRKTCKAE